MSLWIQSWICEQWGSNTLNQQVSTLCWCTDLQGNPTVFKFAPAFTFHWTLLQLVFFNVQASWPVIFGWLGFSLFSAVCLQASSQPGHIDSLSSPQRLSHLLKLTVKFLTNLLGQHLLQTWLHLRQAAGCPCLLVEGSNCDWQCSKMSELPPAVAWKALVSQSALSWSKDHSQGFWERDGSNFKQEC